MSSTKTFSVEQLLAQTGWARSLARQLVVDAAAADDVVQETLVAAIRERPASDRPLRPWLERVVRNFAANSRRSRRTRQQHERAASETAARADSPAVDEVVSRAEGQQRVTAAVLALAEPYRTVVLLRFFEGLSAAEIARRQLVPPGTVRWRLSTGLQQLRERLDADAKGESQAWCLALLPLTGFRSLHELAAGAPWQAAARAGHSSWMSTATGVLAMKNAWMMAVAAVGMLVVSWLWWDGFRDAQPPRVVVAEQPAVQVGDREEAPLNPLEDSTREAAVVALVPEASKRAPAEAPTDGETGWRAHAQVRFVDQKGVGVAGVRVRFARGDAELSDGIGQVALPVPAPFGDQARHRSGLELVAEHSDFATIRRSVALSELSGGGDHVELGTLTLERGGSIAGVVTDATGNPVAGASVSVSGRKRALARSNNVLAMVPVSQDGVGGARGKTDAQGRYRLDGVLAGANELRASAQPTDSWVDELEAKGSVQVVAGALAHANLRLLRSVPEDRVLTVKVVDPDGQPVARAYVHARSNYGNSMASTSKDGLARVGFARGSRSIDLTVSTPDERFATVLHEGAQLGTAVTVAFQPMVPLQLTLLPGAGRSVERAEVVVRTVASGGFLGFGGKRAEELSRKTCEVTDGSVAGLRLPNVRFALEVRCRGHEVGSFGPFEPDQARAGLSLALVGSPVVTGRVLDLLGKPVAGTTVTLHRRPEQRTKYNGFDVWLNPAAEQSFTADADGHYELTLRGQRPFFVRAVSDGLAATLSSEQSVPEAATPALDLDLTVHAGSVITGRILRGDGRTPAGAIVVANRGDGFARTVRADAQGIYRFERMQPGAYEVRLSSEELEAGSWRSSTTFGRVIRELEAPNCHVQIGRETRFDITPSFVLDAQLSGAIEIEGWPLAGAQLAAELADVSEDQVSPGEWHGALDGRGTFSLPSLPSGRVLLKFAAGPARCECTVHLVPGKNRYKLDLKTREVVLRDLPQQAADGASVFVLARWQQDGCQVLVPVEVAADGTAKVRLPLGAVTLERSPTPADGAALLARGEIGMIALREIVVE